MKRLRLYLLFSFSIAWLIWIGSYALNVPSTVFQIIVSISMWAPATGLLLTKKVTGNEKLLVPSLKPKIKENIKWYVLAWFLPVFLTILGAAIYFIIFRDNFDSSFGYMQQLMGAQTGQSADVQALPMIIIAQIVSALTFAPLINMLFALGEEIGWRGFLFPELTKHISRAKAHIIAGLIWGVWHTPINMMGHNYGLDYPGYPWMGIIAMCIFTFSAGVILSWLTENTGSIWPAALGHGAINAAAGLPILFLSASTPYNQLLGPSLSGVIAGLPLLVVAIFIMLKVDKNGTSC